MGRHVHAHAHARMMAWAGMRMHMQVMVRACMCMDMTKDSHVACYLAVECPQQAPLAVQTMLPSPRRRAAATLMGEGVRGFRGMGVGGPYV